MTPHAALGSRFPGVGARLGNPAAIGASLTDQGRRGGPGALLHGEALPAWEPALLLGPACCRTLPWDRAGPGLKDSQADRELYFLGRQPVLVPSGFRALRTVAELPPSVGPPLAPAGRADPGSGLRARAWQQEGPQPPVPPLAAGPEQWEVQWGRRGRT